MLSFRGSHRKKATTKTVGVPIPLPTSTTKTPPPLALLQVAMAYNSSLKSTLANSLKDNGDLRDKLEKMKHDLKCAREKNLKLADYNEWRAKAELGYDVGYSDGKKQVTIYPHFHSINHDNTSGA